MVLKDLLSQSGSNQNRIEAFALLALGIVESLSSGVLTASEAIRILFNAENGCYVRQELRSQPADRIMSHGVQLPDLYDALPPEEAQREFQKELSSIRQLCLELLERERQAA